MIYSIFLLSLISLISMISCDPIPSQVHLSFQGDFSTMAVTWTTFEPDLSSVTYSTGIFSNTVPSTSEEWTYEGITRYNNRALMTGLFPHTQYNYKIRNRSFSFKTLPENPQSYKVCIFGDLGYYHGNSTASIIRNGLAGKFDFIIHVGDIAYDLHANSGKVGDNYMDQLEPLLSTMPYMVIAGNHEDDLQNFTNYQKRFWMPQNGFNDNQFYSFDLGPIHFVGVSTENYGYYYEYGIQPVLTQYSWLQNDLAKARANKAVTPWIASFQHRPFYCSNDNSDECQSFENKLVRTGWLDMPGLESLYLQYGVDLGFWGHEHSYERFYPVADRKYWNSSDAYINPKAPVYIITGSAGCHSGYAFFSQQPWPWSAVRNNDYGYTIMSVANSTHIQFQQISIDQNENVVDDFWISKDPNHINSDKIRRSNPGHKFPLMKCHVKDTACRKTLRQLNREL